MDSRTASGSSRKTAVLAAIVAAVLSGGWYLIFGDVNLNLADEGYLWYGVLRVLAGEVPFRDFQAYDPGRYYWIAAFTPLVGEGILGVRAAAAIFQALGLFLGLRAARGLLRGRAWPVWTVLFGVVLSLWMFPRHKLFEPAIALAVTWSLVRLLEHATVRAHLVCGLVVGLAGWFGRNHALYGALASLATMAYLAWKVRAPGTGRRFFAWGAGVVVGYAPLWLMLIVVPGFAGSFVQELASTAERGTNVPRPYPWPWRVSTEGVGGLQLLAIQAQTAAFLLPPLALAAGLWVTARSRRVTAGDREGLAGRATVIAGTFAGLFYLHHVSVRSDAPHLAQCIHPLLLVVLALPVALGWRPWARITTWCGLALVSFLAALEGHTSLRWIAPWRKTHAHVERVVAGDTLRLLPSQAAYLAGLELVVKRHLAPEEALLIVPARPTLYCVLGRRSPVRSIYFLWSAGEEAQRELLRELDAQGVDWVLIVDTAVDDRDELRFRNTHPLVWRELARRFERVPTRELPPDNILLHRADD